MDHDVPQSGQHADSDQSGQHVSEAFWRRGLFTLTRFALVCLCIAVILFALRRWHWALDLTTHMQAHLLLAACFVAVAFAFLRRWGWLFAACLLIAWGGSTVQPWRWWIPARPYPIAGETGSIRILYWNTFVGNRDHAALLEAVRQADADVIAILEWTPALGESLQELHTNYPVRFEQPGGGAFGIAIYSRLEGTIAAEPLPGGIECLRLSTFVERQPTAQEVTPTDRTPVDVWAVHTFPPTGRKPRRLRNDQMAALAERLAVDKQSLRIVGGDFNITPWADEYRQLLQQANLVDSRSGFGYAATWPQLLGPVGIPIDHVAVQENMIVQEREVRFVGQGSDHAALLIRVDVPLQ